MAKKVVLEIDASQIERATHAISEEEKALARLRAATAEHNKAVKASVDVEEANEILQKQTATSYYEKQKVLTALGKVIRSYVANTEEERAHLDSLKSQYADLNTELKEFDATMGNHQRNVGNYNESVAKPLTQQLREMQRAMAEMIVAGKEGSAEYQEMAKEAGRLKDAITDANNEVKRFANDTMVMSDVVDITKSAVGAFGLLQSATALLGVEDENLVKSIQKLQAAQTALNSIQQLQQTLLNKSSGTYRALLWIKGLFVKQTQTATIALQGEATAANMATTATNKFKTALVKTGIGAIVIGLTALVAKVYEYIKATKDEEQALRDKNKEQAESLKLYEDETKARGKALHDKSTDELTKNQEAYNEKLRENKKLTEEINALTLGSAERKAKEKRRLVVAAEMEQLQEERAAIIAKRDAEAEAERLKAEEEARKERERLYQEELNKREALKKIDISNLSGAEKGFADYVKGLSDDVAKQREKNEEEVTEKLQKEVQRRIDAQKKADEEEQKRIAEEKEMIVNKSVELQTTAINMISSIFEANAEAIQKNIDSIDKQIAKSEKAINKHQNNISNLYQQAALERGAERDALLNAIDEEKKALAQKEKEEQKAQEMKDKAELKQKKEQFKARKVELANQLLQSIANTALAITKVWADTPTFAAPAMTAIVAAMGAINQATIAAQMGKLKMANGGLLHGNSHANGGIPVGNTGIEVEGGEYVVNRRSTAAYLPLLEAINERGRRQYADGGQISLPNIDTTADMLSRIDFNPVVSVVDINRVSDRLNTVRVMSN